MNGSLKTVIFHLPKKNGRQNPRPFSRKHQIKIVVPVAISQDPQRFDQADMVLVRSKGRRQKEERPGELGRLEAFRQLVADFWEIGRGGRGNHAHFGARKVEDSEQVRVPDEWRQTGANGRFPGSQPDDPVRVLMIPRIPTLEFVWKMAADEIMNEDHRRERQGVVEDSLRNDPSVTI